jgi:hypothetical protein
MPAFACWGQLEISAASSGAFLSDSSFTVRVANTGDGPVEAIALDCDNPPGVTTTVNPKVIPRLNGHASILATISTHGVPDQNPARFVLNARGHSDAGPTEAVTTVDRQEAQPATSLALAGNARLTDWEPAGLTATIGNSSDAPVQVLLQASAGQNDIDFAPVAGDPDQTNAQVATTHRIAVQPHKSAEVVVHVKAKVQLLRSKTALVVTATVDSPPAGAQPYAVSASRDLDIALSSDILPGPLGFGTMLTIPGLLAMLAFLKVWQKDRQIAGLDPQPVSEQMWANKFRSIAVAVVISGIAAILYATLFIKIGVLDFLDAYTLIDIVRLSVACLVIGLAVAIVVTLIHILTVTHLIFRASPVVILKAAARSSDSIEREAYTVAGKTGLLVRKDWPRGMLILTPPIKYTLGVRTANNTAPLTEVVQKLVKESQKSTNTKESRTLIQRFKSWLRPPSVQGMAFHIGPGEPFVGYEFIPKPMVIKAPALKGEKIPIVKYHEPT